MLRIALTGGIGSGKSEVTKCFRSLGVTVLDADEISHDLTSKDVAVINRIEDIFGKEVINSDNSLNRKALRHLVFNDRAAKAKLEAILHPKIRQHMHKAAGLVDANYCLFAIPLLVETDQTQDFDRIIVVQAPTKLRRQRILLRSNLALKEIEAIFSAQASDATRREVADDLVINDGSLKALFEKVKNLHKTYEQLATGRPTSC